MKTYIRDFEAGIDADPGSMIQVLVTARTATRRVSRRADRARSGGKVAKERSGPQYVIACRHP
jgi:hypothetical protein